MWKGPRSQRPPGFVGQSAAQAGRLFDRHQREQVRARPGGTLLYTNVQSFKSGDTVICHYSVSASCPR